MTKGMKDYTIEEHKHKFACWAASRAASVSRVCRFRVEEGVKILEGCGFDEKQLKSLDNLPDSDEKFEEKHKEWCKKAIESSKGKVSGEFTYGIAAKLINCYLKARFVCGGHHKAERVGLIHPPIDSLLLKKIKEKFGNDKDLKGLKTSWSKFDEVDYDEAIKVIKEITNGEPLWKIEYCWQGYRDDKK